MAEHILIGDLAPRIQYAADGVQTQFSYLFPVFNAEDLEVYVDETLQSAGYTVNGAGENTGGDVVFDVAPADGTAVTLRRRLTIARQSDFQESGAFRAKVINDELDFLTAALQQVADDLRRSVQLSPTDPDATLSLPGQGVRANRFLAFDADGSPIASTGPAGELAVSSFAGTLLDDTSAAEVRTTIGAQEDVALTPPTIGQAGTVLSVNSAGNFQYDASLIHGAYLTAVNLGL